MPYPDLPPNPTFWRCPACANEGLFRASGTGTVACGACDAVSTTQQLVDEHARARSQGLPQGPTSSARPG